jgi:hypothetical protein
VWHAVRGNIYRQAPCADAKRNSVQLLHGTVEQCSAHIPTSACFDQAGSLAVCMGLAWDSVASTPLSHVLFGH